MDKVITLRYEVYDESGRTIAIIETVSPHTKKDIARNNRHMKRVIANGFPTAHHYKRSAWDDGNLDAALAGRQIELEN